MTKKTIKNILTIGDGIAAWCLHEELSKLENVNVTNISSDSSFPSCSTRSTSINCLRGTRPGVSPLGDLILDSYRLFEEFNNDHEPDGVIEAIEYQTWNDINKWKRRYSTWYEVEDNHFLNKQVKGQKFYQANKAYILDPQKLKAWFKKRHSFVNYKIGVVKKLKQGGVAVTDLGENQFDLIFLATSYSTINLGKGFNSKFDYYLDHCKPVAGTYLEIDISKTKIEFDESFNFAIEANHFIYRKEQGVIQIGSTNDNRCADHNPNIDGIKEIYNTVSQHLDFVLPGFEEFRMVTGIRHKGFERMPFWGELTDGLYSTTGLYKNAFTFSFLAARQLVNLIK